MIAATLNERLVVTENGQCKRITKLEAAAKQFVNRAAGGDARAFQLLIGLIQAIEAKQPRSDDRPVQADLEVLRALRQRIEGTKK